MMLREFPTILVAWHSLIAELAYQYETIGALVERGGLLVSYPDTITIEIGDILKDEGLHLDMSSFGKTRWDQFLKKYFRPDLGEWVDKVANELSGLKKRQVAGYSINLNPSRVIAGREGLGHAGGGHRHGACLASLQLQRFPTPKVILISRASQLDKAGFLDMCLMHLVAKRTGWRQVSGTWIIALPWINAVQQIYYVTRFKKRVTGHCLEHNIRSFALKDYRVAKYGPQRRAIKRALEFRKSGEITRSAYVKDLSLEVRTKHDA